MAEVIKIKKGLDVPMDGKPELTITNAKTVSTVGLVGFDTPGLKPRMAVAVGDRVKRGQALYVDKRNPEVKYTAPGGGTIKAVNRGERRVLNSVVIELDGDDAETFSTSTSAVSWTATPPCWSEREPIVPPPSGTRSVSPQTRVILSIGMPVCSLAIIDHAVSWPWP